MDNKKKETAGSCEFCAHYEYDDEMEEYCCSMNLDEDELYRFLQNRESSCPYFHFSDDYLLARKQ